MELTHSFTVPMPADEAFEVLTDIERIAPCMPGATIDEVDGEEFTGRVKVKVGPMQITYRGRARFEELDRGQRRAVIEARGQEMRGSGTANATVTASMEESGDETEVTVVTSLAVTGRPAQFGRGVMNDVGGKLLSQFADCLSQELSGTGRVDDTDEIPAQQAAEGEQPADADATAEPQRAAAAAPGSNGSAAGVSEQQITQVAGVATPQPPTAAEPAAAASAPPAGSARSATRPSDRSSDRPTAGEAPTRPSSDAIDLVDVAGASVAKRVAPVLVAVVVLWLLVRLVRRRRSSDD